MLVVNISDQLGNQMFAYAAIRTLAEQKGYDFGFIRAHNDRINDTDHKYGNEIHTIFPQTRQNLLEKLPDTVVHTYHEQIQPGDPLFYNEEVAHIEDNTYLIGHFISYQYLHSYIDEVRKWFTFPQDISDRCQTRIASVRKKYPDKKLIAIHFRVGDDYLKQGFLLQSSYWIHAAEYILQLYGRENVIFLPFYDRKQKKGGIVNYFFQHYPCEDIRGTLVEDMCSLSLLENLIVCNSSFSAMAGILNQVPDHLIIRPSSYPAGSGYLPTDCFPEEWISIPARKSFRSWLNYRSMQLKGFLLKGLKRKH